MVRAQDLKSGVVSGIVAGSTPQLRFSIAMVCLLPVRILNLYSIAICIVGRY